MKRLRDKMTEELELRGRRPNTIKSYLQCQAVRGAALLNDYQRCLSTHWSASTVNGYVSTLHALWRYLLKQNLMVEDVFLLSI